jgi:Arc/MetJ-type ribon-helix-helix transcriptional regulator
MNSPARQNISVRKVANMTPALAARVEDYRWENRFERESEAVRRLIELGLDAVAERPSRAELIDALREALPVAESISSPAAAALAHAINRILAKVPE